jgi:hypothetical protein
LLAGVTTHDERRIGRRWIGGCEVREGNKREEKEYLSEFGYHDVGVRAFKVL